MLMQQAINLKNSKHVYTYMSWVYDFEMYRWTYNTESIKKILQTQSVQFKIVKVLYLHTCSRPVPKMLLNVLMASADFRGHKISHTLTQKYKQKTVLRLFTITTEHAPLAPDVGLSSISNPNISKCLQPVKYLSHMIKQLKVNMFLLWGHSHISKVVRNGSIIIV